MKEAHTKNCQNCKSSFTIDPEDFAFYDNMKVPPPTFCPECRMMRRLIFRNCQKLFRVKDVESGKETFSMYPQESGLKLYDDEHWWSDSWEGLDYGRDYDFSRPFFPQLKELMWDVPWDTKSILRMVNSDYSNNAGDFKNCYLCFNGDRAEDCAYCISFADSKSSLDCTQADHLELCYELFSSANCYRAFWSTEIDNCQDTWFCRNCENVSNCFGCVNLRSKQYHIFNEPYSKEGYKKKLEEMRLDTYSGLLEAKKKVYAFWKQHPVKYMRGMMNVDSDGEFIFDSKNVHKSYHIGMAENVKYSFNAFAKVADCYDYCTWGNGAQMLYECETCGEGVKNLKFCFECWPASQDLEYCTHCRSSSDCFACVGLKKKQYCVFNKQYSKEEYFALRNKIIEHMNAMPYTDKRGNIYRYGEFMPSEFSPLAFNETTINELFPMPRAEAEAKGFTWREPQAREFQVTMKAGDLPDSIKDVQDSITKELIECMACKRAYRIIPVELIFCKQIEMPLPRMCHECRLEARRKAFRPPMKWYPERCMCDYKTYKNFNSHSHHPEGRCSNTFLTTHVPGSGDIIYCEACYNSETA